MKFPIFVRLLAFLSPILAIPLATIIDRDIELASRNDHHLHEDFLGNSFSYDGEHEWIPAEYIPGSSRSPCPFLNTMANHGFL